MSIQTTYDISRADAIERIMLVVKLIQAKDYRELEWISFEPHENIQQFVDAEQNYDVAHIQKWTNRMLEDTMDMPFFRHSMFENYRVGS